MSAAPAPAGPLTVCGSLSRYPVGLGRAMHQAGYDALGLPYLYVPFACRDVAGALAGIRAMSIRGVGVSMPFKLEVIPLLDALSPQAARIGAVNTIVNDDGRLTGHNTDAIGAVTALREVATVDGASVLVLGAGGASRAVCVALADAGARLTIANRDEGKAQALAADVGARAAAIDEASRAASYDIVVNASSVGMADVDPRSPVPAEALRTGQVVMDIVYKPLETSLVREARVRGAVVVRGERMLLFQAMAQFALYTGVEAPRAAMETALLRSAFSLQPSAVSPAESAALGSAEGVPALEPRAGS